MSAGSPFLLFRFQVLPRKTGRAWLSTHRLRTGAPCGQLAVAHALDGGSAAMTSTENWTSGRLFTRAPNPTSSSKHARTRCKKARQA
eukprot:8257407-Pyramimonas_sp.AAC.1